METKDFDSYSERKAFDETKGVKGLVDAHITEVPRIFRLPQGTLSDKKPSLSSSDLAIPIIDFADVHVSRPRVVEKIKDAAEKWGFFQMVNHGVPLSVLEEMRDGVRRFLSKISSSTACVNWRDSFACYMSSDPPTPEELPVVCRGAMIEHWKHMMSLGALLLELLSEALGLSADMLKSMDCMKGLFMICHSYPPCPQLDRTIGTNHHSDNSFLTILLQDQVGGLQILHKDCWVDVSPIPGLLLLTSEISCRFTGMNLGHHCIAGPTLRGGSQLTQGFLMTQAPSSSHNHERDTVQRGLDFVAQRKVQGPEGNPWGIWVPSSGKSEIKIGNQILGYKQKFEFFIKHKLNSGWYRIEYTRCANAFETTAVSHLVYDQQNEYVPYMNFHVY
ncbi:unnamed protein product [Brassica oleracea]